MIGFLFILVGALFFYIGWRGRRGRAAQMATAPTAWGVVFDYERRNRMPTVDREMSGILFYPKLRFTTRDGATVETTATYGSSIKSYKINQRVGVSYDAANPQTAEILGDATADWLHVLLMILGAGLVAFGLIVAVVEFFVNAALSSATAGK